MIPAPPTPREAERLDTLRGVAVLDTLPEPLYDDLVRLASYICDTPIALVSLVDDRRQWFKARVGLEAPETPRDQAFCAHAIHGRDIFEIPDAHADERFHDNPLVTGQPNVRFYAGMPLVVQGEPLGTLCVLDRVPRRLTEAQRDALAALGRQVSAHFETRRIQQDLERTSAALRELSTFQRAILDSADSSIVCTDVGGRIVLFSAGAERLLGYRASEVLGQSALGAHLPAELAARARVLAEQLGEKVEGIQILTALAARGLPDTHEWTYVRRDGSHVPVALSITALRDDAGAIRGFLGIAQDITVRREVDRMKDEFVATVSHELRTPLTSIRGALGLLEGGVAGELPDDARELVRIARSNADRLIRLVNDILDLEKIAAGKLAVSCAPTSASGLVRTCFEAVGTFAENARIRLVAQGADATVLADPDRTVQVLVNLVSNAVKFSPAGAEVVVSTRREGGFVRFSVVDRGRGIADSQLPLLFGRFQQLDASDARQKGGTGLGLAISKALVERQGGRIGVESTPGAGSTFWFELEAVGGDGGDA